MVGASGGWAWGAVIMLVPWVQPTRVRRCPALDVDLVTGVHERFHHTGPMLGDSPSLRRYRSDPGDAHAGLDYLVCSVSGAWVTPAMMVERDRCTSPARSIRVTPASASASSVAAISRRANAAPRQKCGPKPNAT